MDLKIFLFFFWVNQVQIQIRHQWCYSWFTMTKATEQCERSLFSTKAEQYGLFITVHSPTLKPVFSLSYLVNVVKWTEDGFCWLQRFTLPPRSLSREDNPAHYSDRRLLVSATSDLALNAWNFKLKPWRCFRPVFIRTMFPQVWYYQNREEDEENHCSKISHICLHMSKSGTAKNIILIYFSLNSDVSSFKNPFFFWAWKAIKDSETERWDTKQLCKLRVWK